jgi:hypothetical protein
MSFAMNSKKLLECDVSMGIPWFTVALLAERELTGQLEVSTPGR